MTTEHDYNKALHAVTVLMNTKGDADWETAVNDYLNDNLSAIYHALRVAKKLAEEPSDDMAVCGWETLPSINSFDSEIAEKCFKAMRSQLYREIE